MPRYLKGQVPKRPKRRRPKKWRLFHATDFQSLMYPCFIFCRVIGMFPYKFNASTFAISKPRYILATLNVCIWCVIDMMVVHNIINSKVHIIRNLEMVCYLTFSGSIMIFTHILSGPRMRLLQTILEISAKLPPKSYKKLSRLIHVKDIFGTIYLIVLLCLYYPRAWQYNYTDVLTRVFGVYCVLLIFYMNMLYINCVYILKTCFKNINESLEHMQRDIENDTKLCVSMLISHAQRNQFLLVELKTLKRWHLMISDAVKMLNIIFSLQLLATLIIIFFDITCEVYFYVVRWQNGSVIITFDEGFFDVFLFSMLMHIIILTLLVWVCETGKNQAHEIRTTIHDLLNNIIDKQIKDELQLFSLQILHRENVFSAKALTVDASLLAGMVGSITTYMLILIQFLIASHSCDVWKTKTT